MYYNQSDMEVSMKKGNRLIIVVCIILVLLLLFSNIAWLAFFMREKSFIQKMEIGMDQAKEVYDITDWQRGVEIK